MVDRLDLIVLDEIRQHTLEENGCWIWQGPFSKKGYAIRIRNGKKFVVPTDGLAALAREYGVHSLTMSNAVKGKTWKHVK